uniref:Ig-like domain-containing protein n=1 Tax=Astatotilapia calliptera TaxID=8154 RepID=A0A3P8QN55_ASTCA
MIYKRIKHVSVPLGVSCEDLTPTNKEVFSVEGSNATLSYRLSREVKTNDYFFWYRQYPGKPPEFLISHLPSGEVMKEEISGLAEYIPDNRYQSTTSSSSTNLTIPALTLADTALYYCALETQ